MNNTLLLFFAVLSVLCLAGGYYADGICIWLSFLTLLVWPILAGNLLLVAIQLFTKTKWKTIVPLLAILLHTDYLLAVYQPPYWNEPAASEQEGTPLTVVTYNASHFYWDRKYTMNEAAAYIKKLQPDIVCFQEAPGKSLKVRAKAVKDLVLKMKSNYLKRAEQADTIHAEIERSPYPVLVCGDFNDTPASYTYRQIRKGLIDGFRDCGSDYQYTFR